MSTAPYEITEKLYTVEEWLEFEKHAEVRHEYVYGKLIPMAGEAKHANRIAINILKKLDDTLAEKGFIIFTHDVKAQVIPNGIYRYPDLVVAPVADDEHEYIVKHPVLMVEVASGDPGQRDRVKKRKEYLQIPSLWYYIVVDQDEMLVELHSRGDDSQWAMQYFTEPDDEVVLQRFGLSLRLVDVYERVKVSGAQ
ncbi:MAG TPA: Uma2 family endonuclease [Saprospiraceae bacterium]|nr:Uma2 family endonuclease [Saprospiraceae bacterium]